MLQQKDLYPYQSYAVSHILNNNGSMLWLDIGLGKTVISLTALHSLFDSFTCRAALVVGPVTVIETVWEEEARKWGHLNHLTFSKVRGTPAKRLEALQTPAHVYLINYEALPWLSKTLDAYFPDICPFDCVIFDEISKMKHSTTVRSRAFHSVLPAMKYRAGLTGTPASNGVVDLHGQYLVIDGGQRLGPNITSYRDRWFIHNPYSRKYKPRRGATVEILSKVQDITIEMSKDDYLQLPPLVDVDKLITLPKKVEKQYAEFEKEFYLEINGKDLEAFNSAAQNAKCRQLANGAVYMNEPGKPRFWEKFHDLKLDMLEQIISELQGAPLLICYQFIHDKERLQERFPGIEFITGDTAADVVKRWNAKSIPLLAGHPKSMAHGLNLQFGGNHICWFGMTYDLEHYQQAIGRLLRNGQENTVFNHRLLAKNTIEARIAATINTKDATQEGIRQVIKQGMLRN